MKKVIKFVKGKREDKREGGITPSQSGDLISPAQTPEDERFLGLDNSAGYIVDFCGKDKTLTKLHKAAWQGNLEKVKNALKKVDIDAVDRHNRTALHFAVVQGHPNIVWFLLSNNARHTICDDEGRTPLLKAVECGHKECINLLLERGANINHGDFSGCTTLHIAVKQCFPEIVTTLMQKGADPEVANNAGEYPLHIALRNQNKDIIQLLLRLGASVNAVDRENRTPLMLAAKTGNLLLAQLFFEYGAQLYVVDSNGWTAEDYALLGGHQNVASELKTLMKKDSKPMLETHSEEDELEVIKSEADTWNDSVLSNASDARLELARADVRKLSLDSDAGVKNENKDDDMVESPGSGIMPPPCQPPRSWQIIEAGMIDEAPANGSEPKRLSITALGSLHSRRESFTENLSNGHDVPKHTLSLNRRRQPKRSGDNAKQRFSFNEEESLKSSLSDEFSLLASGNKTEVLAMFNKRQPPVRNDSGSDWDSNVSSLFEGAVSHTKNVSFDGLQESFVDDCVNVAEDESLVKAEVTLPTIDVDKDGDKSASSSNWDSGDSFKNDGAFPPPPTALELGVNMAKSLSYMKGISIDHAPVCGDEKEIWRSSYEVQSYSLDCLDEGEITDAVDLSKTASSRSHVRQSSISNQKWKSVELPKQQRPADRLIDVNRRINEQLECYDQALRELAESSYAKRQDALISTLSEPKSSKVENYYSLPSSKLKCEREPSRNFDQGMTLPLHFSKQSGILCGGQDIIDRNSGPQSLPFSVNEGIYVEKTVVFENNEKLGYEEKSEKTVKKREIPKTLEFKSSDGYETENVESPMSDELTGSDKSDRKSKRHMLLAMRDIKHAVQVTNTFKTSLDDQILSPLTKVEIEFDLSPRKLSQGHSSSQGTSPGEENVYFLGESQGALGRQETVIERVEFRRKSSSSESGEEPTLWLQEKEGKAGIPQGGAKGSETEVVEKNFSPLGAIYEQLRSQRGAAQERSSCSDNEESFSAEKPSVEQAEDGSQDVSFSSGPIEPLGCKDSGSEPDSSHHDATPIHHYSLKKHHKWLKERLQSENKERHQLEEVATQLAEKAERLQYELADAKEATKSRDEIIALLQGQLSRMEVAYTKSLEDSVHCRLQLTTLEQEILHLKEICGQYEDERESRPSDRTDKQYAELVAKVRQLEEEREGLSRVVVRLEQQNHTLERNKKKGGDIEAKCEENRWMERFDAADDELKLPVRDPSPENILSIRNTQLEGQISLLMDRNAQLENQLEALSVNPSLSTEQQISQSIKQLNKKNIEMESKLLALMEELNSRKISNKSQCIEVGVESNEELTASKIVQFNVEKSALFSENKALRQTIEQMQQEIARLTQRPKHNVSEQSEIKKEEIVGAKAIEAREEIEQNLPDIVGELRKEVQELHETLENTRKGNLELEQQMRNLKTSDKSKATTNDELAWSHLYGIKHVRLVPNLKTQTSFLDKSSNKDVERKVVELEQLLHKAKEEITRQRINSNFRPIIVKQRLSDSVEVERLKSRVLELELETKNDRDVQKQQSVVFGRNDEEKRKLGFELEQLRSQIKREFVPKIDIEVDKFRREMLSQGALDNIGLSEPILSDDLKTQCIVLAREKERVKEVRRRLGRMSGSWEEGTSEAVNSCFSVHSRNRPEAQSTPALLEERGPKSFAFYLGNIFD